MKTWLSCECMPWPYKTSSRTYIVDGLYPCKWPDQDERNRCCNIAINEAYKAIIEEFKNRDEPEAKWEILGAAPYSEYYPWSPKMDGWWVVNVSVIGLKGVNG